MTPLAPGDIVASRYRVEASIARGGMGIVYVAEHVETEQRVALKVLLPDIAGSAAELERFRLEARVFGRLSSEHIVRVLDAGIDETRGLAFIAMELLEGETLHRLVERRSLLAADAVVELLVQTASALDRAHGYVDKDGTARPIVHRDLKPENIFVTTRADGALHAKVLDFGIAKIASSTAQVSTELRGTPQYMAYEQVEGTAITAQTDVAAFGLIAFFCLTGRPYWMAANGPNAALVPVLREILGGTTTPASQRCRELGIDAVLPSTFDGWFARCTASEPSTRFGTAGEAALALAAVFGIAATLPEVARPSQPRTAAPERITSDASLRTELAATVPAPATKKRRGFMRPVGATLVIGAMAIALGLWSRGARRPSPTASVVPDSASAAVESGPTAVPLPTVGKPEAIAVYKEALVAYRDGQWLRHDRLMKRAIEVDPTFAPALVRAALNCKENCPADGRLLVARAVANRDTLGARDAALLSAVEALYAKDPIDSEAFTRLLSAQVEKVPRDAELLSIYAMALQLEGHIDDSSRAADKVLAIDPGFAAAQNTRCDIAWSHGDWVERRRVSDECIRESPRALDCITCKMYVDLFEGHCTSYEAGARQCIAIDPGDPYAYFSLAHALAAQGHPRETVEAAVVQATERLPAARREKSLLLAKLRIALLYGHFEEADARAKAFLTAHPTDLENAVNLHRSRIDIAEELGDRTAAAARVREMLQREPTWPRGFKLFIHGRLTEAALRTGVIDREAFDREVRAWRAQVAGLQSEEPYLRDANARTRFATWTFEYATLVVSPADAKEAMRRFDDAKLVALPVDVNDLAPLAETLLLAGRVADSLPGLRQVAASCTPYDDDPRRVVRANLLLGQALESQGDKKGACEAYASVLARWGAARRSVTADEARDRSKKLGCPSP
jgi:eukaryotic-like serine/threonine-protein kinase